MLALDTSDHIYLAVEEADPLAPGDSNIATVKYDGDTGEQLWVTRFQNGDGFDAPVFIAVDPQGNVYVAGMSNGAREGGSDLDYVLIKYRQGGTR